MRRVNLGKCEERGRGSNSSGVGDWSAVLEQFSIVGISSGAQKLIPAEQIWSTRALAHELHARPLLLDPV